MQRLTVRTSLLPATSAYTCTIDSHVHIINSQPTTLLTKRHCTKDIPATAELRLWPIGSAKKQQRSNITIG